MDPIELARKCVEAVNNDCGVKLVLKGDPPGGLTVPLVEGEEKCPRGEVLNYSEIRGETMALFEPMDLLAWLAATGVIDAIRQRGDDYEYLAKEGVLCDGDED